MAPHDAEAALREAVALLERAGLERPLFEAQLLLALAVGGTRLDVVRGIGRDLKDDETERFRDLVARRAQRIPMAYLRGTQEFYGLEFIVTPAVLVPRPETEALVDFALEFLERPPTPRGEQMGQQGPADSDTLDLVRERNGGRGQPLASSSAAGPPNPPITGGTIGDSGAQREAVIASEAKQSSAGSASTNGDCFVVPPRYDSSPSTCSPRYRGAGGAGSTPTVVDVGTGSGCIAIAVASRVPGARGIALDLSLEALAVALANAVRHGVAGRMLFARADMLAPIRAESADLVLANPPYIPTEEVASLQPEVRQYEPMMALDGGSDGLVFHRALLQGAYRILKQGGAIAIEVAMGQAETVAALVERAGFTNVERRRDLSGIERTVVGRKGAR